jgi:hypothetical protein
MMKSPYLTFANQVDAMGTGDKRVIGLHIAVEV